MSPLDDDDGLFRPSMRPRPPRFDRAGVFAAFVWLAAIMFGAAVIYMAALLARAFWP